MPVAARKGLPSGDGVAIFSRMADQFGQGAVYDNVPGGNNYFLGLLAGLIAAIIGAAVWMGVTAATHLHVGYVALGVGALVGFAVRFGGKGNTVIFGIMGAVLTALSCLTGEMLAVIQLASTPEVDFFQTLKGADLGALVQSIFTNTDAISWFIYAIGIFEGYKFSMRK